MQLVIEIDEEYYNDIKESDSANNYSVLYALDAIRNGTPLPKGHGRLIDETSLIINLFDYSKGNKTIGQCIDSTPTTIRADIGGRP